MRAADPEHGVLPVVVRQHQFGDLVGHLAEQFVTLLLAQPPLADQVVEQHLDVDLVVGAVHAGRVVQGVGVDLAAGAGELDPAALGQAEVAALADHLDAQLRPVHADRVVGLVAHLGVALGGRLHVGADAAVPQQLHRRQQDRLDQFGRGQPAHLVGQAQGGAHLLADRHRLGGARPHPAALADQGAVVVVPGGPGQGEQPGAFGEGAGRVRGGVDEHVPVVEGGHQTDVFGQQHAVAEHVAGHVADADGGELLALHVHAQFPEVAAHALPGAPGGDAHGLVVVADGTARGERVTQPEAVAAGHLVGDVGEGRGALVRGHHQVGVVAVVAHDLGCRHHLAGVQVVGQVEQAGDEHAVAGDALGEERLPVQPGVAGGLGGPLDHEPALGADRHDHRVLHRLGLDQAQDLGAEVLPPVRPAQAAPGHRAEPQVHAFDAGRVHEDLEAGPGLGQVRHGPGVELHRQVGAVPAVGVAHEVVGAQGGGDQRQQAAQDAVGVQAGDVVDHLVDLGDERVGAAGSGGLGRARVEPGLEQPDQGGGDLGVAEHRVLDVVLAVGGAGLAQVLGVGAQHGGLPPVQSGQQHQRVEPVDLGFAPPGRGERVLEPGAHLVHVLGAEPVQCGRLDAQPEVEDPVPDAAVPVQLVGALVDHVHAHPLQHGQHLGQGDALAGQVELEPAFARFGVGRDVERHLQVALGEGLDAPHVVQALGGGERLLVGLGEDRGVALALFGSGLGAQRGGTGAAGLDRVRVGLGVFGEHRLDHEVVPAAHHVAEPLLDQGGVGLDLVAWLGVHHEVHAGQRGLADPGAVLQAGAAEFGEQHLLHGQSGAGGVAVPGQVDQAGEEPAVGVAAQEQAQPAPLGQRDHARGGGVERVGVGGEQFGARVVLDHLQHALAGVGGQREAGAVDDLPHASLDHRDVEHVLVQRGGGEHAEEPVFTGDRAVGVERLHPDVVRIHRTVHCGLCAGLGEHQQVRGECLPAGVRAGREAAGGEVVLAQHAQAGGQHRAQGGFPVGARVVPDHLVVAVAQEGEVSVGQPTQQVGAVLDLLARQRRRRVRGQLVGELARGLGHPVGVLDDLADVVERRLQPVLQFPGPVGIGDQVDLDVHPGFGQRTRGRLGGVGAGQHLVQHPGHVAAHHHDGVHHALHLHAAAGQRRDHRVDQVGHVVGDDLDDRGRAAPAVVGTGRVEGAHQGPAWHAVLGELVVGPHRANEVRRVVGDDFLRWHVPVVQPDQVGEFGCGFGGPVDQLIADLFRADRGDIAGIGRVAFASSVHAVVMRRLSSRGHSGDSTLFGTSVCRVR